MLTDTHAIGHGLTLTRHYDPAGASVAQQCGEWSWYIDLAAQLAKSFAYYDQLDGSNKFLRSMGLHIYAQNLPYPDAPGAVGGEYGQGFYCTNDGGLTSHISARYLADDLGYRYPASLIHEFGHAHHYWSGWPQSQTWGREIADFLTKQFQGTNLPKAWPAGWNLYEAYANNFRCLFDPKGHDKPDAPAGIEPATNHPEWLKMMALLPELCAFLTTYGIVPGSLSWQWDNGFQFKRANDGVQIAHWYDPNNYDMWFQLIEGGWSRYQPNYIRS